VVAAVDERMSALCGAGCALLSMPLAAGFPRCYDAGMVTPAVPAPSRFRDDLRRIALVALGVVVVLLPFGLLLQRPLQQQQLTLIGGGDSLSLLLEGVGGGRVLVGGGASQADVPAALGRHFRPWDRRIDLLIIADRRDLPGATELVRRGMVREVATVGIYDQPAAALAMAALGAACTARDVPLRAIGIAERIAIGREPQIALIVAPPGDSEGVPTLHLEAGPFVAPVLVGAGAGDGPALGAILLRANREIYGLAAGSEARIIAAPASPPELEVADAEGRYLLIVGVGERATLVVEDGALRLRGGELDPLDAAAMRR
jgi:hypothetical protein